MAPPSAPGIAEGQQSKQACEQKTEYEIKENRKTRIGTSAVRGRQWAHGAGKLRES